MLASKAVRSARKTWPTHLPRRSSMSTSTIKLTERPVAWKAAAPSAPPGSVTFASILPKLPVVDLKDTLTRLKVSLKPIAWSEAELATVEKKIDEFGAAKGPELQARLLQHAEETPHWLEQWWDDGGYLGYRDSVRCRCRLSSCFIP
jgi:carnitine O-acetyltransferase